MKKNTPLNLASALLATAYLLGSPVGATELVSDDLLTSSNLTTSWEQCDGNEVAIDISSLDAGGCAFRTTPVSAGITYSLTCGITVAKYASITLAYLDDNDDTLASEITEVFEHVAGAYSVTLQAPANTVTAAIGIYGETGSGFQDCVLVDDTPVETATNGIITGVTWFDEDGDSVYGAAENYITGTPVSLLSDGVEISQQETLVLNGRFVFGNLDLDQCYTVSFGVADSTLEIGASGGDNDAGADGLTNEVCLDDNNPKKTFDAAFVAVAPVEAPADYVVCGNAWHDADASGAVTSGDTRIENVRVHLFDSENNKIDTHDTETGRYVFSDIAEGDYRIRIRKTDGYEAIEMADSLGEETGLSYVDSDGYSPFFNLPGDSNKDADHACTIAHLNGLYTKTEVALEPTVANDDSVEAYVGVDIRTAVLENDEACEGVLDVDLIGHDVPGRVYFNSNTEKFVILDTTEAGTFSIEYGLRGVCGSYDTATLSVVLTEQPAVIPVGAPDAPMCRVETNGSTRIGGVDVFNASEDGFATQYNLYDRDKNFVISVFSDNYTHKNLIGNDANQWESPWIANWEIEWNGTNFGYDQVSIYYVAAVENDLESALTECVRSAVSPIALDLDNQGRIQQIAGSFEVDLDNDGIKEALSRWFAPSAGILVNDNASGKVSGKDLYGNIAGVYADGFEELETLDVNGDGQLTNDELVGLAIWTDLNSDTMVDQSELSSLADHKIVSLAVHHKKFMARAKLSNGKSMLMEDVWLSYAPMAALAK